MKVDLHVHTRFSPDSLTPLRDVVRWAQRHALDALAITDHDTIEGARALQEMAPFPVIVGSEITTTHGDLIGLFLHEDVPPGLSPAETADRIHAQGGLVYVPHPMDRVRTSAIGLEAFIGMVDKVDLIEVLNARVTFALDNRHAAALARAYRLASGAGSDAHQGYEIGRAYLDMPRFCDASTFLSALGEATVHGHISLPLVHMGSTYAKVAKDVLRVPQEM